MDLLKRYWGLVMTLCMGVFGIGWLVVGMAPGYLVVLCGMAIVAAASSLWHLPAMAALSNRFVERRGFALSVYGVGGNVGEILGPATTGLLLGMLTWQSIISTYALLPLLMMFPVFWAFRDIGGRQPRLPCGLRHRQAVGPAPLHQADAQEHRPVGVSSPWPGCGAWPLWLSRRSLPSTPRMCWI